MTWTLIGSFRHYFIGETAKWYDRNYVISMEALSYDSQWQTHLMFGWMVDFQRSSYFVIRNCTLPIVSQLLGTITTTNKNSNLALLWGTCKPSDLLKSFLRACIFECTIMLNFVINFFYFLKIKIYYIQVNFWISPAW